MHRHSETSTWHSCAGFETNIDLCSLKYTSLTMHKVKKRGKSAEIWKVYQQYTVPVRLGRDVLGRHGWCATCLHRLLSDIFICTVQMTSACNNKIDRGACTDSGSERSTCRRSSECKWGLPQSKSPVAHSKTIARASLGAQWGHTVTDMTSRKLTHHRTSDHRKVR